MVTGLFKGQQRPSKSESDRLGNTSVGGKEISGYSENTIPFVQTHDNRARFITHYDTKYVAQLLPVMFTCSLIYGSLFGIIPKVASNLWEYL